VLDPDVHGVVLHFAGVNFIDSQGAATVSEIIRMADASDVELRLAAVRPAVRRVLERQGAVELLGADHIHGNVHRAVAALGATRAVPVRPVRESGVFEEGERQ
jgi:sulfate permease, SulP family